MNRLEFDRAFIIFFMFGTLNVLPRVEPDGLVSRHHTVRTYWNDYDKESNPGVILIY